MLLLISLLLLLFASILAWEKVYKWTFGILFDYDSELDHNLNEPKQSALPKRQFKTRWPGNGEIKDRFWLKSKLLSRDNLNLDALTQLILVFSRQYFTASGFRLFA